MGKQSKEELEKRFWEKWKVKIFNLFKKSNERREQESKEKESYMNFIYEYTEIHGVRETARRLEENGFKIDPSALSKIRNGIVEHYGFYYISDLAQAIGNLGAGQNEKKVE